MLHQRRSAQSNGIRIAICVTCLVLTAVGILFVHSTTADGGAFPSRAAKGQIAKAAVGILALLVVARIDYRRWERYGSVIYAVLVLVLVAMLIDKFATGGRNRFIDLGFFQIQPSAFMMIALVLGLARYLRFRQDQRRVSGLVAPFLLTLGPMALVLLQPNLGLSLLFPPVLIGMLFVAGSKPRHLALAVFLGFATLPAAYFLSATLPVMKVYQKERLREFFGHKSHHLQQSLIAVGSGGVTGKGLGEGTQNRLGHLPAKDTDFIFSIVAEELGFVGAASLVVLFLLLTVLILRVAVSTREPFGRLVATGFGVALAVQCFENIGMTLGLTPITGIPLPFVSLAGSSLVATYLAMAIVLNISSRRVRVVAPKDLDPPEATNLEVLREDRPAGLLQARWPVE